MLDAEIGASIRSSSSCWRSPASAPEFRSARAATTTSRSANGTPTASTRLVRSRTNGVRTKDPPRTGRPAGLVDFERGVKMAGSRHYVLTGAEACSHEAILDAFDFMTVEQGFAMSVPVIVKEVHGGHRVLPGRRDQAYHRGRSGQQPRHVPRGRARSASWACTRTRSRRRPTAPHLPTVSTCFRREAGAAGKDTAGSTDPPVRQGRAGGHLQGRCRGAEDTWHERMIGFVEAILGRSIFHRLLQCCTGDLGQKNET